MGGRTGGRSRTKRPDPPLPDVWTSTRLQPPRSPQSITREVWLDSIDARARGRGKLPEGLRGLMKAEVMRAVTDLSQRLGALELTHLREKQRTP